MSQEKVPQIVNVNSWQSLRQFTQARIALGRCGASLPTAAHLDFQFAHARARDAVHQQMDVELVSQSLAAKGLETIQVRSAASDRKIYLQRPDQGRRLAAASRHALESHHTLDRYDVAFVIADGLSALAIHHNVTPLLDALLPRLKADNWLLAPTVIVQQGRVAVGDEIGEVMRMPLVVVLIGERPGLSSPDSLGIYLTYGPYVGISDAQRNCISNVRPGGLSYAAAAHTLHYLMTEGRSKKISGVKLKDESVNVQKSEKLLAAHLF